MGIIIHWGPFLGLSFCGKSLLASFGKIMPQVM